MNVEVKAWDGAEFLKTPEALADYIDLILAEDRNSPAMLIHTIALAARVRGGIPRLSAESGIPPEELTGAIDGQGNAVLILQRLERTYQAFAVAARVA